MKALVLKDYMEFEYTDVPDPVITDEEVLIKVKAVGICGSDVHGMDGSTGRRIPPLIMGHEASGVIEKTGSKVKNWKTGDRVTFDSTVYNLDDWFTRKGIYNLGDDRKVFGVSTKEYKLNGAYAEYVAVPQHILYKLPDSITFTQAAMVEPAAVALHAVEITPVSLNDTAVVIGAGMIGLFLIQVLRIAGCGNIIAVDIEDEKLAIAKKLGADIVLNPTNNINIIDEVQKVSGLRGADIAFEAVGITQTIKTGIEILRKGGTLTIIGNISPTVEISLQSVVTRQLRLQGSCAINGEYPAVLDLISRGEINVEALLSAEAPLSEGDFWFYKLYNKTKGLIKVVLIP